VAEGGWLKLYRELIEKPIWKCTTPEQKAILITLLCMANHEEQEWIWQGKKYKCKPGQFITSLKSIAEKSGTSIKNVRTALKNFEQIYEFSASESTNKNRLVTITNWELYQSREGKAASRTASKRQASGKQRATNKNDKNDKNDKNISNIDFSNHNFSDIAKSKIEEWLTYKKERRENYKPTGLKSLLTQIENNISTYGEQKVIDLISECMAAGYKGIIWDKLKKPQYKQNKRSNRNNFEQRNYDDDFYNKLEKIGG
jgi:hypothetical protein